MVREAIHTALKEISLFQSTEPKEDRNNMEND